MEASWNGHIEIVKLLIEKGADVNRNNGFALIGASWKGHTEIVKLLISKGADVNAKIASGWTALMRASEEGHTEIVRLLLDKGADLNAEIEIEKMTGWTAAMLAAGNGHTETIEILRDKGAVVPDYAYLIGAARKGDTARVKALLETVADINVRDKDGNTALIAASRNGHSETVGMLLRKGANVNLKFRGETALMAATEKTFRRNPAVIKLLIESGAEGSERALDIVCNGAGISNATAYPTGSVHPVMIIHKNIPDPNEWKILQNYYTSPKVLTTQGLPQQWQARDMNDLQLVICVDEFWDSRKTGFWTESGRTDTVSKDDDGNVTDRKVAKTRTPFLQKVHKMNIKVVAARSGNKIQDLVLFGFVPEPKNCIRRGDRTYCEVAPRGDAIEAREVISRLKKYVGSAGPKE